MTEIFDECNRVLKPGGDSEIFNGRGTYTPRQDEGTPARFFCNTK